MIIECPHCRAKYSLDEKLFAGRSSLQGRCSKCKNSFSVAAPAAGPVSKGANATETKPASPQSTAGGTPVAKPKPAAAPRAAETTMVSKLGRSSARLPDGKVVALSVTQGPQVGKVFRFDKPQVVLGRVAADILIEDPEVSRRHCAIEVSGPSAWLMDLGTTNGTFVDGQKVATHELQHLSEFRIGSTTLMFTITTKGSSGDPG